ncbi:MAG: LemA family protein [Patescibacteria group bacterium]|jgi:LemA protein
MSTLNISLLGAVLLAILFIILTYNNLVRGKTRVAEAWADIDVQLKRRYDLIPNLIETVKGYQKHESETLEKVTAARTAVMKAVTLQERGQAEAALSRSLQGIFAVAENYPDLKASANFVELQRELTDTEDKIQAARRFYNGLTRDYNISLSVFPSNVFAALLKFSAVDFFELAEDTEREPVKVAFSQ